MGAPRDQGDTCLSCWAFATATVLESHVALYYNQTDDEDDARDAVVDRRLSPQQLVSCVPNPRRCGGEGGCRGSTAELALRYVLRNSGGGLVAEDVLPYDETDYVGDDDETCHGFEDVLHPGALVDYVVLPSNNAETTMNALAKVGPLVVSVAAHAWNDYESGVFSTSPHENHDVNHVVALVGYGTDDDTGQDYWLAQNSYGADWGEDGYIRLLRTSTEEPCAVDKTPLHGVACEYDEHGNKNDQARIPMRVCGTSGILFDVVLPVVAKGSSFHDDDSSSSTHADRKQWWDLIAHS